jgi:hypothetical protein
MPVLRYFVFVGAALIALLFVVSAQLPSAAPAVEASNSAADLTSIRIRSDRKWPERVVFDTSAPTIVPAPVQTASVAPRAAGPEQIADTSTKVTARDAYAQLTPTDLKKPAAKPVHKRRVAKRRMAPPTIVVAQRPQFGLFANNIW